MSESIGAALRKRREQRQLTLQQVSEATRIRVHSLQALENDDISAMPSAAQARGFLRIYATFLELDLQALIPPPAAEVAAKAPIAAAGDIPTTPSAPVPQPEAVGARPGPLAVLRDLLIRRLGHGSPGNDGAATAAAGADTEIDAKKKELH